MYLTSSQTQADFVKNNHLSPVAWLRTAILTISIIYFTNLLKNYHIYTITYSQADAARRVAHGPKAFHNRGPL